MNYEIIKLFGAQALMDCEISRFRLSDMYHLQRVRTICQDREICSFTATRDFFDYKFKCEDINPIFYMELSYEYLYLFDWDSFNVL